MRHLIIRLFFFDKNRMICTPARLTTTVLKNSTDDGGFFMENAEKFQLFFVQSVQAPNPAHFLKSYIRPHHA